MKDTFLFCKREYDRLEEMLQAAISRKEWQKAHDLQTEQGAYAAVMEHCFKNEFPYASSVYCTQESKPTWKPNWEDFPEWVTWASVDYNGLVVGWKEKPDINKDERFWYSEKLVSNCTVYPKVDTEISSKHWQEMIWQRPQFKPDWSKAPEWAKRLLIDDDGTAWWSDGKDDSFDYEFGMWESRVRFCEAGIIKNALKNYYERPQDDIIWEAIPDNFNYVAKRCDGSIFCFKYKPKATECSWRSKGELDSVSKVYVSDNYLKTPWRDSLRERPKGE